MQKKQDVLTGPAVSESLVLLYPNIEDVKSNVSVGNSMSRSVAEFYNEIFSWFDGNQADKFLENYLYEDIISDDLVDEDDDDDFRY